MDFDAHHIPPGWEKGHMTAPKNNCRWPRAITKGHTEHQSCDTFSVSPHLPQGCTLLAAGYLPRSVIELWVSMTRLDDLDNAGAEEDDSCQRTVKLAFLPSSFLHWAVSRGKKLSVLTLHPSCRHLLLVYLHTAHLFFNARLAAKTFSGTHWD